MSNQAKVVFITGASSGIGRLCAEHLAAAGYVVYGSSRRPAQVPPFTAESIRLLPLDVTDAESVQQGITAVLDQNGRLDVLINNAGFGIAGPLENTTILEAQAQFDTNVWGVLRTCQAVLPAMRRQGDGLIINMSSIAGLVGVPFAGIYGAGKFALEGMTEALRLEVKPFGVRVVLVEPGDYKTNLTVNRRKTAVSPPYTANFTRALTVMETNEQSAPPPTAVAHLIRRIIEAKNPRPRYKVGPFIQRVTNLLQIVLPWQIYDKLLMDYYDIG